jgi:hypothetical protein
MAPSSRALLCVAALALVAGALVQPYPRDVLAASLALDLAFYDCKVPSCAATSKPLSNALLDATALCASEIRASTTGACPASCAEYVALAGEACLDELTAAQDVAGTALIAALRAGTPVAKGVVAYLQASSAASLSCQSKQKTANQPTNHSPTTTDMETAGAREDHLARQAEGHCRRDRVRDRRGCRRVRGARAAPERLLRDLPQGGADADADADARANDEADADARRGRRSARGSGRAPRRQGALVQGDAW